MSKNLFIKNRNKDHIEPVLNFWAGKLWFEMVDTCQFEIQVKGEFEGGI